MIGLVMRNVEPESRTRDTGATELKDARRAVGESHARKWSRKEKKQLLMRACRWVDEENTSSRVFRFPKMVFEYLMEDAG